MAMPLWLWLVKCMLKFIAKNWRTLTSSYNFHRQPFHRSSHILEPLRAARVSRFHWATQWSWIIVKRRRWRRSTDVLSIITKLFKSRTMRWAGHVARMGDTRKEHRVYVGKPGKNTPRKDPGAQRKILLKWILRKQGAPSTEPQQSSP